MNKKKTVIKKGGIKIIQKNKSAFFHYEILERKECGLCLKGTEIKSIRIGEVSLKNAFVQISKNLEAEVHQLKIKSYEKQNNLFFNHKSDRIKKLLLHKKEIIKLQKKLQEKGLSIVVLSIYLKHGLAKLELGVGRGKKLYDKRVSIKERDEKKRIKKKDFF